MLSSKPSSEAEQSSILIQKPIGFAFLSRNPKGHTRQDQNYLYYLIVSDFIWMLCTPKQSRREALDYGCENLCWKASVSVVNQTVAVMRHFHKERLRPQLQEVQTRITSVLLSCRSSTRCSQCGPDIVIELR